MTGLDPDEDALLECCASRAWARAVAAGAPYADGRTILAIGEAVWWSLGPDDWREALAAHPRIGDRPPPGSQERREQAAADCAPPEVLVAIAEGNRTYEERFGMTYVVRASGRSAEEMLALLCERLMNDPDDEVRVAAAQQWEITALRLRRLAGEEAA
jgi:OHCU decarboxylase